MSPPQSVRPPGGDGEDDPNVVGRADLAERRARRAELGEQMQARRAAEAEGLVAELTSDVMRLENELDRAMRPAPGSEERLADARRELRAAEQRAHAERRRRLEAAEESAERLREAREEAAQQRERARRAQREAREQSLEAERLRRRMAEAEQAAAAAEAAGRRRVEHGAPPERALPSRPGPAPATRAEWDLAAQTPAVEPRGWQLRPVVPVAALDAERRLGGSGPDRGERLLEAARELAGDLAARLAATPDLTGELAHERAARQDAEAALAQQREVTARVAHALAALRAELAHLREAPLAAPGRPAAQVDLAELGRRAAALAAPPAGTAAREDDPFAAARQRLRAAAEQPAPAAPAAHVDTPPEPVRAREPEPGPEPAGLAPGFAPAAWLPAAWAQLARAEPALAAHCASAMLPALGAVAQAPVAFTLALGERTLAGDASPGRAAVVAGDAPVSGRRPDFRLRADPAAFGRFLAAPSVRSWLVPPGGVRIRGRRRRAAVLRDLVRTPLGFGELAAHGVDMSAPLALALLSRAIDPAWTAGHSLTLAFETTGEEGQRARAFLEVRDGRPLLVTPVLAGGPPAATVSCSSAALLPLLAGVPARSGEEPVVAGDAAAFALVQSWAARAQGLPSGSAT